MHKVAGQPFNIPLIYKIVLWNNFLMKKNNNNNNNYAFPCPEPNLSTFYVQILSGKDCMSEKICSRNKFTVIAINNRVVSFI